MPSRIPGRLNTHAAMLAFLGGRASRRLAANKVMWRDQQNNVHVRLHGTDVVTAHPDNTFTIRHGGWNTPTTHRTIGDFSPARTTSQYGSPIIHHGSMHPTPFVIPAEGVRVDSMGRPLDITGLEPPRRERGMRPGASGMERGTGSMMGRNPAAQPPEEAVGEGGAGPRQRRSPQAPRATGRMLGGFQPPPVPVAPQGWQQIDRNYHTPENLNAYGPGGIDQGYVNRNQLPVAVQEWFDHVSADPELKGHYLRGVRRSPLFSPESMDPMFRGEDEERELKRIGTELVGSGLDPMEHAHFTLKTGNPKYASAIMKLANKGNPRAIEHLERLGMPELAPGEYRPPEHHPEWPHTGRNPEIVVDPATGKPKIYRRRRYSYKSIRHPVLRYQRA